MVNVANEREFHAAFAKVVQAGFSSAAVHSSSASADSSWHSLAGMPCQRCNCAAHVAGFSDW
jgi:hypothetical protein